MEKAAQSKLGDLLGDSFIDRVVLAISSNEGSFTSVNLDDAGYGISIGIRQWNQKAGELPDLLRSWHEALPEKFRTIFGDYSDQLLDDPTVRKMEIAGNSDLMSRFRTALADADFQQLQVELARAFARNAVTFGFRFGFRSELGLALMADIVNQKGRGGAELVMRRNMLASGGELANEPRTIELVSANSNRAGAANRFARLKQQFNAESPARLD